MSVYAVVDANGLILNRIVINDLKSYPVSKGLTLVQDIDEKFEIGASFVNGKYVPINKPVVKGKTFAEIEAENPTPEIKK